MQEFGVHFVRPLWLLAALPAAAIVIAAWLRVRKGSAWRRHVDAHLLRHLAIADDGSTHRGPLGLLALGWLAAVIALAGPAFDKVPRPVARSSEPTIVALDVSKAMDAADVAPSGMERARHEVADVLERSRAGQVGLVLYAQAPFVASPLTDDVRVIEEMIPVLDTRLMPAARATTGNGASVRPDQAIDAAAALLEQAGSSRGRILLIGASAGDDPAGTRAAAERAAAHGYEVSALAIGGDAEKALTPVALAGNGRAILSSTDDADVAQLIPTDESGGAENGGALSGITGASMADGNGPAADWRDLGVYVLLLPLLLAPLAFRRGWLAVLVAFALLSGVEPASAATSAWDDLWRTHDQQGARALASKDAGKAAALFESPDWKAAAHYESGRFDEAAAAYAGQKGTDARYNQGNALARAGKLEDALKSYDTALAERPDDPDTNANRDLVKRLLEQQRQQQQQQGKNQDQKSGQQGDQNQQGQQGQSGEQGQDQAQQSQGQQGQGQQQAGQDQKQGGQDQKQGGQEKEQGGQQNPSADASSASSDPKSADGGASQQAPQPDQQTRDEQAKAEQAKADQAKPENEPKSEQQTARAAGTDSSEKTDQDKSQQAKAGDVDGDPSAHPDSDKPKDDALQAAVDRALEESPEAKDPPADSPRAAGASARERSFSEAEQTREQLLRQIPDDPGGLLRAKIRRHLQQEERRAQAEDFEP